MPVYEYACACGVTFDRCLPVAMYRDPQFCDCGKQAVKQVCAPSFFVPQDVNYTSPIDGRVIRSMQEREEDLKRADCVPWEPGIAQDGKRREAEEDAALDKEIDAAVEKTINNMPEHKKTQLANELASGADINLIRN